MATKAQLEEMRRKAGIGEFSPKAKQNAKSSPKTVSRASGPRKTAVYDWDPNSLLDRFGGIGSDPEE